MNRAGSWLAGPTSPLGKMRQGLGIYRVGKPASTMEIGYFEA